MTKHLPHAFLAVLLTSTVAGVTACSAGAGNDGSRPANIVGGVRASDHPEAVLVDMDGAACSGSLIAPRVVLTAGHCVDGSSVWTITAPYAGGQRVR